jgi:hypothetical protein
LNLSGLKTAKTVEIIPRKGNIKDKLTLNPLFIWLIEILYKSNIFIRNTISTATQFKGK